VGGDEAVLGNPVNELERIEAEAVRMAVGSSGGRAEVVGGAVCVAHPRLPILELNRAIPISESVDLDAVRAWFDRPHAVCLTPERGGLTAELDAAGYTAGRAWMKFERDASPPPEVKGDLRVGETFDSGLFGSLVAEGAGGPEGSMAPLGAIVGSPGWHCFVAWADDEPAASAAIYVDGSSAWLGIASTRAPYRRRGAQSALLAARIELARFLGVQRLVSETGERVTDRPTTSYDNLLRAGFAERYLRANLKSPE
jgi:GNAT superfamily N-acetyltransferase